MILSDYEYIKNQPNAFLQIKECKPDIIKKTKKSFKKRIVKDIKIFLKKKKKRRIRKSNKHHKSNTIKIFWKMEKQVPAEYRKKILYKT